MFTGETMIARDMLEPGDHIYRYGKGRGYTHHGIYVGEEMVIHFTRTEAGGKEVISRISSSSSHHKSDSNPCPKCNYKSDLHRGVVKTCLDCFLSGQKHIWLYKYGVSKLRTLFGPNPGGTTVHSGPPSQVVDFASLLLEKNGFGNYNLMLNNCENFAYHCKTGKRGSRQFRFIALYVTKIGSLFAIFGVNFVFEISLFKFVVLCMLVIVFLLTTKQLVVFRDEFAIEMTVFKLQVFHTIMSFYLPTEPSVVSIVKYVLGFYVLYLL